MNWITKQICAFITDVVGGIIEFFGWIMNNIFFVTVAWNNNNEYVKAAERYFLALGLVLVSVVVAKQVMSGYVLETDYDADADPFNLIVRVAECVAVICSGSWIFNYTLRLSKKFVVDIIGAETQLGCEDEIRGLLLVENEQLPTMRIVFLFLVLTLAISMVVFTGVAILRGGELIAMKLLLPFFALDMITTNRERWNDFKMGYLIAFFSYGFQVLFLNIALKSLATASYSRPYYLIMSIAWMIMAIRAPKFIEKYIYKSGISSMASGGMRMVAQAAILRRMG